MEAIERARAKLNLALHVRARRTDGYHEIETLFAFVEHGDEVRVRRAAEPGFTVTGPFGEALAGESRNLGTRAAAAFAEAFGGGPWDILLDKRLPVASGIGGGSADAAATLRALARLAGVARDDARLFELAERLGSDVPACLFGKTALGLGRGERLQPLAGAPGLGVLLVNPGVAVSTAEVFAAWDGVDRGTLGSGPLLETARRGRNDLEAPALQVAPVIGEALTARRGTGPTLARMSGSGATCFGLYADAAALARAAEGVRAAHPAWWVVDTRLTD